MENQRQNILKFLSALRNTEPVGMVEIYTKGKCYHLFLILKTLYPEAECWYTRGEGHVYTKINSKFYDINGICYKIPKDIEKLCHKTGHRPHRWSKELMVGFKSDKNRI